MNYQQSGPVTAKTILQQNYSVTAFRKEQMMSLTYVIMKNLTMLHPLMFDLKYFKKKAILLQYATSESFLLNRLLSLCGAEPNPGVDGVVGQGDPKSLIREETTLSVSVSMA